MNTDEIAVIVIVVVILIGGFLAIEEPWKDEERETYRLTIEVSGEGHVDTNPEKGTHTYDTGEEITIEWVPADDGTSVENILVNGETISQPRPLAVTMNCDKVVIFETKNMLKHQL